MSVLAALIRERLQRERVSIRTAAKDIGIAHTTVTRILADEPVDMKTWLLACKWLRINPADALRAEGNVGDASELASRLAIVIQANPALAGGLINALRRIEDTIIPPDVLREIVSYTAFRLLLSEKPEAVGTEVYPLTEIDEALKDRLREGERS